MEVARNTPLLIQLFFLYFGLPSLGIKLSNFSIALLAMFLGGGYMTEVIRSGLDSISKSQVESGYAIGLNKWQLFRFVVLPQAATISAPALFANFIFLLKETSIVSAIAVPELLYTTTNLISIYYKTSEMLIMLTASYIFLFVPLSFLLSWLERRNRYGTNLLIESLPQLLKGLEQTLLIACFTIIISTIGGILFGIIRTSKITILRFISRTYIEL